MYRSLDITMSTFVRVLLIYFFMNFISSIPWIKASFMKKPTNALMNFIRCLFKTPTYFGRLLRPSSGCRLLKSTRQSCVWRIGPKIIKFYKFRSWADSPHTTFYCTLQYRIPWRWSQMATETCRCGEQTTYVIINAFVGFLINSSFVIWLRFFH